MLSKSIFKHTDASERRRGGPPRLRLLAAAFALPLLVAISASPAPADEIYFKSGYSQTAVVIRETEKTVRFKSDLGLSSISREKIDFVEKATEEENRALLKKWREKELRQKEMAEAKREAQRKFETEQLAKGLVKFEDEWMTRERKQEILALRKRARAHKQRFEAEQRATGLVKFQHLWVTPEQEMELLEMEPEIYGLHDELTNQQKTIDSIRSAMLKAPSIDEAERLSQRIEEISNSMAENKRKLNRLLKRTDQIEAASVRYEVPDEFLEVLKPGAAF